MNCEKCGLVMALGTFFSETVKTHYKCRSCDNDVVKYYTPHEMAVKEFIASTVDDEVAEIRDGETSDSVYSKLSAGSRDLEADSEHFCDNCDWEGSEPDQVSNLYEWMYEAAGGIIPSGQCPKCQVFTFLKNPAPYLAQARLAKYAAMQLKDGEEPRVVATVKGGLIQVVYSNIHNLDVVIVDYDRDTFETPYGETVHPLDEIPDGTKWWIAKYNENK